MYLCPMQKLEIITYYTGQSTYIKADVPTSITHNLYLILYIYHSKKNSVLTIKVRQSFLLFN